MYKMNVKLLPRGKLRWLFMPGGAGLNIFWLQELAGDVVQNLKDFFRTMYKKVNNCFCQHCISFLVIFLCASYTEQRDTHVNCRSLKLILKSLKQTIEDQNQRRKI